MSALAVMREDVPGPRPCAPDLHRGRTLSYERLETDVAQKLDLMFGRANSLVMVHPGRVLMPPEYQDIGERISQLQVRPDDVWLVSYPRTGSTWAQEMVWLIGHDLDFQGAKQLQQIRTPLLELSAIMAQEKGAWKEELDNSVGMVEAMPSPRYIKSHLPLELLPLQLDSVQPKVVYVARNPKDMCVSYYHYCRLVHNLQGSFEDFCELFLRDRVPVAPVWNHILGFWKRRNSPNILFLKYEDMKRDQEGAIRQTAAFLGKTLSEDQVKVLAEHLSFDSMKRNPAVNLEPIIAKKNGPEFLATTELRFIRKGQVGDWRNHMGDELATRFDWWTQDHLRDTGLSFD
ncbi:luciferin sulfotransferase-like [Bacillus rossius redtenbacheri]|uniref:luciferin sulfotransferase-like n=1 Tax=Bacillus rossius redtenbacheri TaxID=93214 RepID=UPI002FDDA9B9